MSDLQQHLNNIAHRLSVNAPFGADSGSLQDEEKYFQDNYDKFKEKPVKTFEEAKKNPFFGLLLQNLQDGLSKLKGWSNWLLLEYWDESVNALQVVLITDNKNNIQNGTIDKLGITTFNLSTINRLVRELHVHLKSWQFNLPNEKGEYFPENKLSLDVLLPDNPYFNDEKCVDTDFYNACFTPLVFSDETKLKEIFENSYYKYLKTIWENAKKYESDNKLSADLNKPQDIKDPQERLKKYKTKADLLKDIKDKLDRNFSRLKINKDNTINLVTTCLEKNGKEWNTKPVFSSNLENEISSFFKNLQKISNNCQEYLYIPVFTTFKKGKDPQRKDLQIGSVLIGKTGNAFAQKETDAISAFAENQVLKWYTHYNNYVVHLENLRRKKVATRNAISSVMAGRNMSHNHGSHVLSRIRIFKDYYQKNNDNLKNYKLNTNLFNNSNNSTLSFDELQEIYNNYLQTRMDFLADATMEVAAPESNMYFISQVLGELDKNRMMLDLISGIDDFKFFFKLKHGNQKKPPEDFLVSIPNNVVGCHAFYTIVENYIRNIAKHEGGSNINIVFDVSDYKHDNKHWDVKLYFESNNNNQSQNNNAFKNKELAKDLNEKLLKPVINDNYILRDNGWGLIEMKAAAAYLRKINMGDIDEPLYNNYKPGHKQPDNDSQPANFILHTMEHGDNMAYRFLLRKPADVLIIDETNAIAATCNSTDEWQKHGITLCVLSNDNINNSNAVPAYNPEEIYPHKLVVHIAVDNTTTISGTNLSPRILKLQPDTVSRLIPTAKKTKTKPVNNDANTFFDDLKRTLWHHFIMQNKERLINNTEVVYWKNIIKTNNNKEAYYCFHGKNYSQPSYYFHEIETSATNNFRVNSVKINDDSGTIMLAQSAYEHIAVIDERIQEYAKTISYPTEDHENIPVTKIYKNTFVHVPDKKYINLNHSNLSGCSNKVVSYLSTRPSLDFIIIHLTLIEKMKKADNFDGNIKDYILEKLCNCNNKEDFYRRLIITSGRGKPQELPNDVRYLNYSVVAKYLTDTRNKYLLSLACNDARNLI